MWFIHNGMQEGFEELKLRMASETKAAAEAAKVATAEAVGTVQKLAEEQYKQIMDEKVGNTRSL